ncbi:FHF complex subunit HOOK-interacting protein 1A isoform X8 [Tursiops truncatus]|uniref:FHF complex subunit HOOK-interacting protein 1A isoform X8 n=1 Tax=Tursiops truncatus TaxID=9739 RepID=UPI003CCF6BB3
MMSSVATEGKLRQAVSLQGVDPETCMIVFKNHWAQVVKILEKHDPLKNTQAKYGFIPPDEASAVQNYVEHMLFLLIEEQARDAAMGPILEFVVSENIMEKLFLWSLRREFTDETKMEQLKMYEMLITQSHQPLLHHKPILKPLMMLLSSCSGTTTPTVEGKLVVLLNQLCSILAKDPSILELFFHTSEDQGAANFLIFSLLIPFIHREGTVGQQARDALLFIMSLSAENSMVAHHIVENTYFCPVAHPLIRNQLVNYIYNGFLVPVLAPALHKLCVVSLALFRTLIGLHCEDVMLQLILRYLIPCNHMMLSQRWAVKERDCYSVSAARLLALTPVCCSSGITLTLGNQERDYILWSKCTHESPEIIRTKVAGGTKPWQPDESHSHPLPVSPCPVLTCVSPGAGPSEQLPPEAFSPSACIVEYGKALDISYLQYLWEAHTNILRCIRDCHVWSALYDGDSPDPEALCPALLGPPEERAPSATYPVLSLPQQVPGTTGPQLAPGKEKSHTELEWDDSYDTGISSGVGGGCPAPYEDAENSGPPAPVDPPRHIQEMKKNAILLFKGAYIEESDFQDDVMVYRLCAEKDAEDTSGSREDAARPPAQAQTQVQGPPVSNGPLPGPQPETDSEEEHGRDDSDVFHGVSKEPEGENEPEVALESSPELAAPNPEAEHGARLTVANPEGEDFIAHYDQIIKELDSSTEGLMEQNFSSPDPLLLTKEPEEEENESKGEEEEGKKEPEGEGDDFDSFIAEAPAAETPPSPFGARDEAACAGHRPARTQSTPFTGPFISVVLSKLENMLENSLHVNLLLIGIITQLASYPQPLLRSFLLNTNMVFQPSVRSLYQVLASVKNKIEQFASGERDFPSLLIQAQQYLLFRVDLSDPSPEAPTKVSDPVQDASRTGSGRSFLDGPPRVLQPFLTNRAKVAGVPPSLPPPVRDTMLAAALFPEFLKELAALAQEHSILCCKILGDSDDSYC